MGRVNINAELLDEASMYAEAILAGSPDNRFYKLVSSLALTVEEIVKESKEPKVPEKRDPHSSPTPLLSKLMDDLMNGQL